MSYQSPLLQLAGSQRSKCVWRNLKSRRSRLPHFWALRFHRITWNNPGNRLLATTNHYLFPPLHMLQNPRKMRLGLINCDRHQSNLDQYLIKSMFYCVNFGFWAQATRHSLLLPMILPSMVLHNLNSQAHAQNQLESGKASGFNSRRNSSHGIHKIPFRISLSLLR